MTPRAPQQTKHADHSPEKIKKTYNFNTLQKTKKLGPRNATDQKRRMRAGYLGGGDGDEEHTRTRFDEKDAADMST